MEKESPIKFLSKIFLGELSKTAIVALLAAVNLPTLFVLFAGKTKMTLQELWRIPIGLWQWSTWLLMTSAFMTYSIAMIILVISIHKYKVRKRSFYLFSYNGYQWKLLLPERTLSDPHFPLCPVHGVTLSSYVNSNSSQKCPLCDVAILKKDYFLSPIATDALHVGIAMLDGHYKRPKK